jgi:chromate reductase
MTKPVLIALSGSTRSGSYNSAVLTVAVEAARSAGAEVDFIDLRDFPMPIFQQDLEEKEGLPEAVKELKARFRKADGFLIASPEYNSAFSPLLKNTIDWCSRAESDDEAPLSAYAGKSALLLSASPGALGGLRGLTALRALLQNIRVTVFPEMLSVGSAHEVIGEDGSVSDPKWERRIRRLVENYATFAGKLAASE